MSDESSDRRFYPGMIVFDRRRTDPTDDPLVVTDATLGTLDDLGGETYRMVKHNDANQQLRPGANAPVEDSTRVIEAAYLSDGDIVMEERTYTFPTYRLATIETATDGRFNGLQPHQATLAVFYAQLVRALQANDVTIKTAEDFKVLAMQAAVDGEVILDGDERARLGSR